VVSRLAYLRLPEETKLDASTDSALPTFIIARFDFMLFLELRNSKLEDMSSSFLLSRCDCVSGFWLQASS
jgi:hypothetical protein